MNQAVSIVTPPLLRRPKFLGAAVLAVFLATGSQAFAGSAHVPYKQTAVFGTLLTWAYALWSGAPLNDCSSKGLTLRYEHGVDDELTVNSFGISKDECLLKNFNSWQVSYTPMLMVTNWSGDKDSTYKRSAVDIAAIPMIRWKPKLETLPVAIDFEVGIGAALLSEPSIGRRQKSTNFQFSDHFGIGVSDPKGQWRAGFAFRHLSNLDLERPNNGANFFGFSLEVRLP